MYTYLTGSASWYLLTIVTKAFGVHGKLGNLVLEPKLVAEQFGKEGKAHLVTRFADRILNIVYINPVHMDFGVYRVCSVRLDGQTVDYANLPVIISRSQILALDPAVTHLIEIDLG